MASPILWPVAGTAALGLGQRAMQALGEGLSFAAELARGNENAAAAPPTDSVSAAADSLASRIDGLARRIAEKLRQAGVLLAEPVAIVSDGLAGLAVSGDHPQRWAIEQAVGEDVLLERDFDQLAKDWRDLAGTALEVEVGI